MTGRLAPLPPCLTTPALWIPAGPRSWTLEIQGDLAARIEFQSSCGSPARGKTAEGQWTFKRVGFFQPHLTVRFAGEETDLARMEFTARGQAVLRWNSGTSHLWRPVRPDGIEAGHLDGRFRRLLLARSRRGRKGVPEGLAEWSCHPVDADLLSVLALFAWYRLVLEWEDRESAAVAAALSVLYS